MTSYDYWKFLLVCFQIRVFTAMSQKPWLGVEIQLLKIPEKHEKNSNSEQRHNRKSYPGFSFRSPRNGGREVEKD